MSTVRNQQKMQIGLEAEEDQSDRRAGIGPPHSDTPPFPSQRRIAVTLARALRDTSDSGYETEETIRDIIVLFLEDPSSLLWDELRDGK